MSDEQRLFERCLRHPRSGHAPDLLNPNGGGITRDFCRSPGNFDAGVREDRPGIDLPDNPRSEER